MQLPTVNLVRSYVFVKLGLVSQTTLFLPCRAATPTMKHPLLEGKAPCSMSQVVPLSPPMKLDMQEPALLLRFTQVCGERGIYCTSDVLII